MREAVKKEGHGESGGSWGMFCFFFLGGVIVFFWGGFSLSFVCYVVSVCVFGVFFFFF